MEVKTTDECGVSINDKAGRVRARLNNECGGGGENMHHPSLCDTSAQIPMIQYPRVTWPDVAQKSFFYVCACARVRVGNDVES